MPYRCRGWRLGWGVSGRGQTKQGRAQRIAMSSIIKQRHWYSQQYVVWTLGLCAFALRVLNLAAAELMAFLAF
jgi:hypothetical protein